MKAAKTIRPEPVETKSPGTLSVGNYRLRLFVAGATARSHQAILRVQELCATELKGISSLEVIDIYQQPALARANQIVATPTLIIELPRPVRRLIGNLSSTAGLIVELAVSKKGKVAI